MPFRGAVSEPPPGSAASSELEACNDKMRSYHLSRLIIVYNELRYKNEMRSYF